MTRMTQTEKEQFLADLHVGVLSIPRGTEAPLTVPVWYDYEPGATAWFITGRHSRKGKLLSPGVAVSLCAQSEELPYRYVTVAGTVVSAEPAPEAALLAMATRYLGEEQGQAYTASAGTEDQVLVRLQPESWLAVNYGKG